jgi:DNA polymerase-3 subunit gamma/tau
MAYLAMSRKWRPNTFGEMTGQEHVVKTIENAVQLNRIHHAFLFTGTRGVGKTTSARIFAKTLNCSSPVGIDPCGKCQSCLSITSGSSMDVLEIDGASNTSVDDVRNLIDQVAYAPMHGTYRVVIIDEVHMLSKNAFNALLKTLEEPPPHAKFIFATTEVNKVPQTILSRVQRFDFKRIPLTRIQERLEYICEQESIPADAEALHLVADKADGSMRDALTLLDQVVAFCGNELNVESVRSVLGVPPTQYYLELLRSIRDHDIASCIEIIGKFLQDGVELDVLIEGWIRYLRDALCVKTTRLGPNQIGIPQESYHALVELVMSFGQGDILRLTRLASETQREMREGPHPRIALEVGLARMAWLDRTESIRKLLQKHAEGQFEESEKKKSLAT